PGAGYLDGYGAFVVGILAGVVPFFTFNYLVKVKPFSLIDDTLGIMHTHLFAGALGGLLVGLLADPAMIVYQGTGRTPPFSVTGLLFGNPRQLVAQVLGLVFVLVWDGVMTLVILKVIGLLVPLRLPDRDLEIGDVAVHGDVAYELAPQPSGLPMSNGAEPKHAEAAATPEAMAEPR
ncbi:MAG: ammonium transporter, partial [Solirubrobacteraceae bacterium]